MDQLRSTKHTILILLREKWLDKELDKEKNPLRIWKSQKDALPLHPQNTGVAQLVEHRSPKPGVGSSSLSSRAGREDLASAFYKVGVIFFALLCPLSLTK